MPTILSMKDRIKLTLGKITFTLKPLSIFELNEVDSFRKMESGVEVRDILLSSVAYMKYAVKGIDGVKMNSGEDYKLEFEPLSKNLTDDCVSELFTLSLGAEFYHAIQPLKENIISKKPLDLLTNKPLKGVKLEVIPFGGLKN